MTELEALTTIARITHAGVGRKPEVIVETVRALCESRRKYLREVVTLRSAMLLSEEATLSERAFVSGREDGMLARIQGESVPMEEPATPAPPPSLSHSTAAQNAWRAGWSRGWQEANVHAERDYWKALAGALNRCTQCSHCESKGPAQPAPRDHEEARITQGDSLCRNCHRTFFVGSWVEPEASSAEAPTGEERRSVMVLVESRRHYGQYAAIRSKKWDGQVQALGGKLTKGESALAAAKREVQEEAGIEAYAYRFLGLHRHEVGGERWVVAMYYAEADETELVSSPEGEAVWAKYEDLLAGTFPGVVRAAFEALDTLLAGDE
ncbi:MAG: NUDIX domain-containing protein [Myxococcales bacterium]|nr:NUDIX domain-containing protein [Myxococcales bacterium]